MPSVTVASQAPLVAACRCAGSSPQREISADACYRAQDLEISADLGRLLQHSAEGEEGEALAAPLDARMYTPHRTAVLHHRATDQ